jgi:hypothetical protein
MTAAHLPWAAIARMATPELTPLESGGGAVAPWHHDDRGSSAASCGVTRAV